VQHLLNQYRGDKQYDRYHHKTLGYRKLLLAGVHKSSSKQRGWRWALFTGKLIAILKRPPTRPRFSHRRRKCKGLSMILRGCSQLIVAFSYFTRQKMSSAHSKFVINGDFLQMYTKLASGIYSIGVLTGLT
jgi:hypothetical protein